MSKLPSKDESDSIKVPRLNKDSVKSNLSAKLKRDTLLNKNNLKKNFNKEKDDEIKGSGNSIDFGARMYDPRLGTFLSLDKMAHVYPYLSPFTYSGDNPILFKDIDGHLITDGKGNIVFIPVGKTHVAHGGDPSGADVIEGYVFANDGTAIAVFKNTDAMKKGWDTDCHGATFTGEKYWINNDQVPALLKGDSYQEISYEDRQEGDKVIYTNLNNQVEDSRTVTKNKDIVHGQGGLEEKSYDSHIENTWESDPSQAFSTKSRIFRKTNKDIVATPEEIKKLENKVKTNTMSTQKSDYLKPTKGIMTYAIFKIQRLMKIAVQNKTKVSQTK